MTAPGLLRVKAAAGLGSLVLHALALGAVFFVLRVPQAVDAGAPVVVAVELAPAAPSSSAAPPPPPRRPRADVAVTAQEATAPAPVATTIPLGDAPAPETAQPLSRAEIDAYSRAVWLHLAARRPRAAGARRDARITFALSAGGDLRYARLERSSGSPHFDAACLEAVRHAAPFPEAPAGASEAMLVFVAPFSAER